MKKVGIVRFMGRTGGTTNWEGLPDTGKTSTFSPVQVRGVGREEDLVENQ